MASEAQRAACRRYYERTKKSHKVYIIRLNRKSDKDVIAALDKAANKTDYIRELVREDIDG